MTVLARDAEPGKLYRLTRDPGTTYYQICPPSRVASLEKRLSTQSVQLMKSVDRFMLQTLERCRLKGHVLGVRYHRYRKANGEGGETKGYVDFPPDYMLREVERPPGYGKLSSKTGGFRSAPQEDDS